MIVFIPTPADFSFQETLAAHGWRRLLPFVWHEETQTLERAEEAAGGGVVRWQIQGGEGYVHVEVQGDGDEADIERRVRRMLQLDLSLTDFHAYCRTTSRLAHIVDWRRGRMLRGPTLFEDVVKVIATTNTTWAQTIAMTTRLVERFGDEGRTFPTPSRIADVAFEAFAAEARLGYRSAYVHAIATKIAEGKLNLEAWQDESLSAGELRNKLLSLPGIGPYGAACLMLYLGKPAHVNADSVARARLGQELGRAVTDKDVQAFFAPHGEWQGLVYNFYAWQETRDRG